MNLNEFATEVHQNARDHGFWENERDICESISLVHSEWSEALEEARAGRPLVWRECREIDQKEICDPKDIFDCLHFDEKEQCSFRGKKPEGIAVELIDGCIRILDLFGKYDRKVSTPDSEELKNRVRKFNPLLGKETSIPTLVCALHSITAKAGDRANVFTDKGAALLPLESAVGMVLVWISEKGIDPEALMTEKHQYNKGRPYKHGKKF